jgi:cell division septation protein DedD
VREVGQLREKIQISLDDRQVIALGVCALLLLFGVFSLGILLGKKVTSSQPPRDALADLGRLDAEARRTDPPTPAARPAPQPDTKAAPAPVEVPRAEKAIPTRSASLIAPPARQTTVVPAPPARPVQVPPAVPTALTPPPMELGNFTVQVGASRDRSEAARLEARARSAGLKPYALEANLGAKGTWYRVRVGAFRDRDAADRFRLDVERELRSAAVVMPAH